MGKKSDTVKPTPASVEVPVSKKSAKPEPEGKIETTPAKPAEPKLKNGDGAKNDGVKKKTKKVDGKKAKAPKKVKITAEDIALRAYFIAEHRQRHGLHGDEHADWVEAERQLKAEKKATKKNG